MTREDGVFALPGWQKCIFLHTTAGVQALPSARESTCEKQAKKEQLRWLTVWIIVYRHKRFQESPTTKIGYLL